MLVNPVKVHAVASQLKSLGVPVLPRVLDYFNRLFFCCWFPHTVRVGRGTVLGYGGMGVVVHSDAVIGDNVHIDQGVTIGGNGTELGVPAIGNDVYVGAGAKILGPISIGSGSVIGANSVVLKDVPPRSLIVGVPGRIIRSDVDMDSFLFHRRRSMSSE